MGVPHQTCEALNGSFLRENVAAAGDGSARRSFCVYATPETPMPDPELTREMITEGMARAEAVACAPGDPRCYPFPDPVDIARASCTPKGR
jgi:hypothetical protein